MNKLEQHMLQGRLYQETYYFRKSLQFVIDGIRSMLVLSQRNYVSVSFGKQSICLAHMLWKVRPEMPMFFLASSESYLMHNFVEVIDAFMQIAPINLTIVQSNHAALDISDHVDRLSELQPTIKWRFLPTGDPAWSWKQVRDAGDDDLAQMVSRDDFDGWFWGLAKEESKSRRLTLSRQWEGQPHPSIFRYSDGKYRCCPLMNWHLDDLAAYIYRYKLPLLDTYHEDGLTARTTARLTRRSIEEGFMAKAHGKNPALANQFYARFPELRAYR